MKFYAQEELDKLYRQMKTKPYSAKEPWEKFIDDDRIKQSRKTRKTQQHEISYEHIESQEGKG